ncbi:MAG: GNAT family N-acetyltransferase [Chitinophagales bacterium]
MEILIRPYQKEDHDSFKQLNLEWLEHYHLTETHDMLILDDPEGTVTTRGGFIWMAEADGNIVGSAGIMKEKDGEYELIKMGVTESYRGKGISKLLLDQCLSKAREIGAKKLSLYSNHQLATAITLYEKYGFYHVELVNSPLETADIRMEMIL